MLPRFALQLRYRLGSPDIHMGQVIGQPQLIQNSYVINYGHVTRRLASMFVNLQTFLLLFFNIGLDSSLNTGLNIEFDL